MYFFLYSILSLFLSRHRFQLNLSLSLLLLLTHETLALDSVLREQNDFT